MPVKLVKLKLLCMPWATSSTKSPPMHCSAWMQTRLLIRLTDGSFSTISSIYAHRWLFISRTVIVYHIAHFCSWRTWNSSSEETTQGNPLAMPVYAIGITTLLKIIKPETPKEITMKHVAFGDDLGGTGELLELRRWWDNITDIRETENVKFKLRIS